MSCLVASLIQVMLDPHFRTITGFQSLIQKEWVMSGYPFLDRCNHLKRSEKEVTVCMPMRKEIRALLHLPQPQARAVQWIRGQLDVLYRRKITVPTRVECLKNVEFVWLQNYFGIACCLTMEHMG